MSKVSSWVPDTSLSALTLDTDVGSLRPFWNAFPYGTFGITVFAGGGGVGNNILDFLPCDPRLCSVNKSGATDCGSIIYDLFGSAYWDDSRGAPLQALCRVIKGSNSTGNTLAWNIGYSGARDVLGGLVVDSSANLGRGDSPSGGVAVLASVSVWDGGFLNTGAYGDKHVLSQDADGNPINAAHISTATNFVGGVYDSVNNSLNDGPLRFEGNGTESKNEAPYPVNVHFFYDNSIKYSWVGGPRYGTSTPNSMQGMWIWRSSCFQTVTKTPGTPHPPTTPSTPNPPGNPGPTTPTTHPYDNGFNSPIWGPGNNKATTPKFSHIDAQASKILVPRIKGASTAEISESGSLGRPQKYANGAVDLRNQDGWMNIIALEEQEKKAPAVGRLAWIGAQKGTIGGPYLSTSPADQDWKYTQTPNNSREVGGTASGVLCLMPPEVSPEDVDVNFAPTGIALSNTYFLAVPGARFASGLPEMATGGIKSGWSFGHLIGSFSTDFAFYSHDSLGAATEKVRFSNVGVGIGTSTVTAALQLKGGTTGASGAPLKFTSGTNLSSPEAGAVEFDGTRLYITNSTPTRKTIAYSDEIPTVPTLVAGTYTPTLTNVANLDSSSAFECQYMRVDTVVTVSGKVTIDPTTTLTDTQLGISLPISSNLGAEEDCAGTASSPGIIGQVMGILGDASNNRATMRWKASDVTSQDTFFTFTYQII